MIPRTLRRVPGIAAVVVLSLAVGIGVNVTVFSWLQAVVLKPLPGVAGSGSFLLVEPKSEAGTYPGVSWPEYRDLLDRLQAFQDVIAFRMAPLSVGEAGRTERVFGMLVSGNYFTGLGLSPSLGRFLQAGEVTQPGAEPVVVVSHDYWQTRLAGSPQVVGRTLRVNDATLTIVGVGPQGFQGTVLGLQMDLWVPATLAPTLVAGSRELEQRGARGYSVMGRLRPGATSAQAQAELAGAMRELAVAFPETNAATSGEVLPFWQSPRGPQRMFATALGVLQGLMLLVLLTVCGNIANLQLARASSRQREVGVRLALGAGPARVMRLLLAENLLLGLAGAALGALFAVWGTTALRAMPAYGALPIRFQTGVDGAGLALALALGLVCGLLFGLAPAWQLARLDPQRALREGSRTAGRSLLRNTLMGLQTALAVLVLIAAGLFFKSFADTRITDPGFRTEGVLLATYDLSGRSSDPAFPRVFAARVLERLRALPTVEGAALSAAVPLDIHGLPLRGFTLEGRAQAGAAPDAALSNVVSPGYFQLLDVPFVEGADFADLYDTAAPPQVVVNEAFARRFLPAAQVLGRRLTNRGVTYTIIGVVRDSTYESFGEAPTPAVFYSYRDRPSTLGEMHLRTRPGAEGVLASEVQRVVHELDASLPVFNVRTMTEHIDKNLILRKIPARLFLVVAPLLLGLVAMGVYAVVAYSVAHRTAEIGVRVTLGAAPQRVVRQIVGEGLAVIGFGVSCGWVLALVVDLHLFGGGLEDAVVLGGVPVVLLAVAAVACWIPARRAALVDPVAALRAQ